MLANYKFSNLTYDEQGFSYKRWPRKMISIKWSDIHSIESYQPIWSEGNMKRKIWAQGRIMVFDFNFQSEAHFLMVMQERTEIKI